MKCALLSERRQPEKAVYCMIPSTGHSGKSKTVETAKYQWLPGEQVEHRDLRAVKLLS